ncbi:MAG: hypothetical protein QOC77_840 [Thermoleophilaceae bacterium]|nr:hypothetical protein [Thermoleophilaceae bacterium]
MSVAALAATAPAAGADIFAVTDFRAPSTCAKCSPPPPASLGIELVDISTGLRGSLPAAVNTSADEFRPSITSDGTRMVFMRNDGSGALRIIMVDLASGQTADLFNGFEVAAHPPRSPEITPDGTVVLTGGQLRPESGKFRPVVTATDVTSFPTGPFSHTDRPEDRLLNEDGFVDDVAAAGSSAGSLVSFQLRSSGGGTSLALAQMFSGSVSGVNRSRTGPSAHPALGSPGGSPTLAFDEQGNPGDRGSDIAFIAANISTFGPAASTFLPIDTSLNETRPAFTPDGRYLAFVRTGSDGHDRLFAWDSETQTLVNSTGIDLGDRSADVGSPSLYVKAVFTLASVAPSGLVSFSLLQPTGVGILVQRVVGHHKLFGRKVPTLKPVGRVPLGHFKKGHGKVKWNLRVNGKRLKPGTYQVTPRAVTGSGKFRDFGRPAIIRVRKSP